MYTQTEIKSYSNKNHIYAPKGVEVTVISTGIYGICIVEYNNDRFCCRVEKLGDNPPIEEVVVTDEGFNLF